MDALRKRLGRLMRKQQHSSTPGTLPHQPGGRTDAIHDDLRPRGIGEGRAEPEQTSSGRNSGATRPASATAELAPTLEPTATVGDGRYQIQRLLHSAPTKQVYIAADRVLGCLVALDVFRSDRQLPNGLKASVWEARLLAKLGDHPNI